MEIEAGPRVVPWFSVWMRPRRTLRWILGRHAGAWVVGLATVSGIAEGLDRASVEHTGDVLSLPGVLTFVLLGGGLGGLASLYLFGFLLRWTGRWLGGEGSPEELRAAVAVPNLVTAWGLLLWIPLLAFVGAELFQTETPRLDGSRELQLLLSVAESVSRVLGLWYVVVGLACLAEVQRFSYWKALVNVVLALLVVVGPVLLLILLFGN